MPKEYRKTMIAVILLGLLSGFADITYASGYALGCAASVLLYIRNDRFWSGVLDSGSATKYTGIFHFLINYLIMAGVLLVSALYPQFFNIFTCAVGLMLLKISVIIKETILRHRKEG